jgi:hypothetical protein
MTESHASFEELRELADMACDGLLPEHDAARLEQLLSGNVQAQRLYLKQVCLDSLLQWEFTHPAEQPQQPSKNVPAIGFISTPLHDTLGYMSSGWPMAYLAATMIVGIGLAIAAFTQVSLSTQHAPQIAQDEKASSKFGIPALPKIDQIGRITGMIDCVWEQGPKGNDDRSLRTVLGGHDSPTGVSRNLNSPVSRGDRFALRAGLLEITYNTGAKVVLQGPVTFEPTSEHGGHLAIGKLAAQLQRDSRTAVRGSASKTPSFAITTPTAIVTDLGTEFAVEVSIDGKTASHVFQGVIEVQAKGDGKHPTGEAIRLTKNESALVTVASDGTKTVMRSPLIDPKTFVRIGNFAQLSSSVQKKTFLHWQTYRDKLRKDPSLLAYYDFQLKPGSPGLLPNVAANGDKTLDGVVENATWSTGRMPGKHALLFNGQRDCVRLNLPQRTENLTLAAWVCVQSLDHLFGGLLTSTDWGPDGRIHWQIVSSGCVEFGLRGSTGTSRPIFQADRLRKWTHLVCVYDLTGEELRMYADGQLMGKSRFTKHTGVCIGPARIGQWNGDDPDPNIARCFNGWIDELAIFGQAINADAVMRLYEDGKPQQ